MDIKKRYEANKSIIKEFSRIDGLRYACSFMVGGMIPLILFLIIIIKSQGKYSSSYKDLVGWTAFVLIVCGIIIAIAGSYIKQLAYESVMKTSQIISLISVIYSILILSSDDYEELITVIILFNTSMLIAIIYGYVVRTQCLKKKIIIESNLNNAYLELTETCVCGISFSNIEQTNNGQYFEVEYEDIRNIRIAKEGCYNLHIDHKLGTFNLVIKSPDDIKKKIINIKERLSKGLSAFEDVGKEENVKVKKERYVKYNGNNSHSIPVYVTKDEKGMIECPTCGRYQQGDRYVCWDCDQVFINGQANIPYWCGKCGQKGPFELECTKCGSSIKIMNNRYE